MKFIIALMFLAVAFAAEPKVDDQVVPSSKIFRPILAAGVLSGNSLPGDTLVLCSHGGRAEYLMKLFADQEVGYPLETASDGSLGGLGLQVTPLFAIVDGVAVNVNHAGYLNRAIEYARREHCGRYPETVKKQYCEQTPAIWYGLVPMKLLQAANNDYEAAIRIEHIQMVTASFIQVSDFDQPCEQCHEPVGLLSRLLSGMSGNDDAAFNSEMLSRGVSKTLILRNFNQKEFSARQQAMYDSKALQVVQVTPDLLEAVHAFNSAKPLLPALQGITYRSAA